MNRRTVATIALLLASVLPGVAVGRPEEAPAKPLARASADDRYGRHVEALKKRLPDAGKGFTVVIQKPFVVIGDGAPAAVRRRAKNTVKWAVTRLKQSYFAKDPPRIIDIYLFEGDASYRKHAKALFGDTPTTRYGYYSASARALIMNIATGGGTLVHEIVHPFVAANFPACPSWFNEGLASLYEQCGEREGRIVGYTNWRLPKLQEAIRAKALPSFERLCATTRHAFYNEDRGTNYAQARYLCYYLQEKGLLRKYYRMFVANHGKDPTGHRTLAQVLDEKDMAQFQKRWEAWVLTLRFR